jgi:hypothetical protein
VSTPVRTEKPLANVTVMSALGHERTSHHVRFMSVLPVKADLHKRGLHVRLVPIADIAAAMKLVRFALRSRHILAFKAVTNRRGRNGGNDLPILNHVPYL